MNDDHKVAPYHSALQHDLHLATMMKEGFVVIALRLIKKVELSLGKQPKRNSICCGGDN